jgi:hypothetical protein
VDERDLKRCPPRLVQEFGAVVRHADFGQAPLLPESLQDLGDPGSASSTPLPAAINGDSVHRLSEVPFRNRSTNSTGTFIGWSATR